MSRFIKTIIGLGRNLSQPAERSHGVKLSNLIDITKAARNQGIRRGIRQQKYITCNTLGTSTPCHANPANSTTNASRHTFPIKSIWTNRQCVNNRTNISAPNIYNMQSIGTITLKINTLCTPAPSNANTVTVRQTRLGIPSRQ